MPSGAMTKRLGHLGHAVGHADAVLRVVDHRPVAAALGEEAARVVGFVVVGDADEHGVALGAVGLVEGLQLGVLRRCTGVHQLAKKLTTTHRPR